MALKLVLLSVQKTKGTLGKRTRNRKELEVQDWESLKRKEANNEKLIETHENKVIGHLKLRKRRRFKTAVELQAFSRRRTWWLDWNIATLKNVKLSEQMQLYKKLGGITKVGDTKLYSCSYTKVHPEPLTVFWKFFELVFTRE